jgi:hypothetical protein
MKNCISQSIVNISYNDYIELKEQLIDAGKTKTDVHGNYHLFFEDGNGVTYVLKKNVFIP